MNAAIFVAIVCMSSGNCTFFASSKPTNTVACEKAKESFLSIPQPSNVKFAAAQCMDFEDEKHNAI